MIGDKQTPFLWLSVDEVLILVSALRGGLVVCASERGIDG